MKNITKSIFYVALGAVVLSSCIKETFPESSTVTQEQIASSASALDASANGISAQLSQTYLIYGEQESELDIALPGLFIAFSELTGEMFPCGDSGYDHFQSFNTCIGCGPTSYRSYVPWRTLYIFVKSANDLIKAAQGSNSETAKTYEGIARTYRALWYYYLLNMYEPKANKYTDCSAVLGLTVPIVDENTTEAQASNNPRASHEDLVNFILGDLAKAEELLKDFKPEDTTTPSLPVVLGLKAKVYMTDGKYADAYNAADAAITAAKSILAAEPLTEAQWLDENTGFNTAQKSWLWHFTYSAENMGNLGNWLGWMSGEADWGYASLTVPGIDAALYDKIPDTDFRKHAWIDPEKSKFYAYKSCRGQEWIDAAPAYTSLKFRPVGGDYETYSVGGVADVPIMRVEELYLIKAEAAGLKGSVADGVDELTEFIKAYRQKDYDCSTISSVKAFEEEILFQKKVEFWGEGIAYFDAKRMEAGCKQSYAGTNAPGDDFKINCDGIKPNWNFIIPETETSSNAVLKSTNNPDPSGKAPKVL